MPAIDWGNADTAIASGVVIIEEWKPVRSGALRGWCRVQLASGMILEDCGIFQGADNVWVGFPSKPVIDRDGNVVRDANGRVKYVAQVHFTTRARREALSQQILAALARKHPQALAD